MLYDPIEIQKLVTGVYLSPFRERDRVLTDRALDLGHIEPPRVANDFLDIPIRVDPGSSVSRRRDGVRIISLLSDHIHT